MKAGDIIHKHKEEIIDKWLNTLKSTFPQVKKYGRAAIEDDAPELLDAVIEILETNEDEALDFIGASHGRQRTNFEEYSLLHVIREYRLLKHVLFKVVDNHTDVKTWERDKVMYAIDQATEEAAEKYFQLEKEKVDLARRKAEEDIRRYQIDDELRDDFINSVSHDLNNPINNIKFAVQLMDESGADEQKRLMGIIAANTSKAEKLIKDLLDVNRVNSGAKLPIRVKSCDIVAILRGTVGIQQLKHHQEIRFESDLDKMEVNVDCDAILRAVDNLLDNAIKYGDSEKPITLECRRTDGIVTIAVSNYGKAIPLDQQAHIFSRFYRIDETQNTGWGIGLPLVKAITEAHGGKVSVESMEGQPTTFTIAIPADSSQFSSESAELQL